MRSFFFFNLIIFFILTSCTLGVETYPIYGNSSLSDGNSKVWLVDHLFKNSLDFQQPIITERDLIIFYSSGKCRIVKWKDFGKLDGDVFYYRLIRIDVQKPKLILIRGKKKWEFVFKTFTNDKMILNPINGTSFKYEMTIIPLPEW
jgi:hypothetical protein